MSNVLSKENKLNSCMYKKERKRLKIEFFDEMLMRKKGAFTSGSFTFSNILHDICTDKVWLMIVIDEFGNRSSAKYG
jgi:hypothetical protein